MPARALRRAATLLVAAAALCGGVFADAATAAYEDYYGINAQSVFDQPTERRDAHLDAMADGGLRLVRRDASWIAAEPAPPDSSGQRSYDWTRFDAQVEAYARRGLRWLPILSYSTTWSGRVPGDPFSPPARTDDYTSYAAALARRYGRGGEFWSAHPELVQLPVTRYEVWNEQNAETFWHPQDRAPEDYADLYLATRTALRSVDPAARVIVGGLALGNRGVTSETEFLERMYRHRPDLRGNVDALGFHPYAASVEGVYAKLKEMRATLARLGAARVPLELTEIGWTTTKTGEADRAAALSRLALELPRSDCRVDSLIPHTWLTSERDPANPEDWFGIYNADATPKPSGAAYLGAVGRMRGLGPDAAPTGALRICSTSEGSPDARSVDGAAGRARPRGPALRLRVARRGRGRRVKAIVRCPSGCGVRLELLRPARRASAVDRRKPLTRRSLRFSSRRRSVALRVPRRRRMLDLRVTAKARSGGVTRRVRRLRLRCRPGRCVVRKAAAIR